MLHKNAGPSALAQSIRAQLMPVGSAPLPTPGLKLGGPGRVSMTVRAIGDDESGELTDIERYDRNGNRVTGPIVVGAPQIATP